MTTVKLKYLLRRPLQYGLSEAAELSDPDLPRYVRITDLTDDGRLDDATLRSISWEVAKGYLLGEGDLLFARSGATVGKTALYDPSWGKAAFAGYLIRASLDPAKVDFRFLYHCTCSSPYWAWVRSQSTQATIQNVGADKYANLEIPAVPLSDQRKISRFLDDEAAKVDDLLAKKRRLLILLDEKRAALISRAVTQGLDPSAPTKDSGVAWLGCIPADWTEHRLSGVADFVSGATPTIDRLDYWDGAIPWASAKDMKVSYLSQTEDHITDAALREWGMHLLQPPAVLLVVRGMILAHSLPVAVSQVPMTVNQDMKALVVRSFCLPDFLMRWFQGSKHGIASLIEQSAHGTRCLRTDLLKQVRCFLPGLEEQAQICRYIAEKSAAFEATVACLSTAIDRLREYRSALITAAVTGQLDIREHEKKMEALT